MTTLEPLVPQGPLRFGEMVVGTFRYLRRNPGATLGIGALLGTVTSIITGIMVDGIAFGSGRGAEVQRALSGETLTAADVQRAIDTLPELLPYLGVASAVALIAQFAAMGVMTVGMVQALRGERVEPAALWRLVPWRRVVVINLLVLVAVIVVIAIGSVLALVSGGLALLPAMLGTAVVVMGVATVSTLAVPAAIIEDAAPVAALRRAWRVTRPRLLSTTWLVVASILFWSVIGDALGQPIGLLLGTLAGGPNSATGSVLTSMVAQIVAAAIALPASSAMAVLVFRDRAERAQ